MKSCVPLHPKKMPTQRSQLDDDNQWNEMSIFSVIVNISSIKPIIITKRNLWNVIESAHTHTRTEYMVEQQSICSCSISIQIQILSILLMCRVHYAHSVQNIHCGYGVFMLFRKTSSIVIIPSVLCCCSIPWAEKPICSIKKTASTQTNEREIFSV